MTEHGDIFFGATEVKLVYKIFMSDTNYNYILNVLVKGLTLKCYFIHG